jgi:transcriptional regulator of acetoin/glycerol metabolism
LLLGYQWPGNIRELHNVLSLAAALAVDGVIEPVHLELPETKQAAEGFYHQRLDTLRREMLLDAIAKHGHNQARIARYLGISRQGVSHLFKQFKIA